MSVYENTVVLFLKRKEKERENTVEGNSDDGEAHNKFMSCRYIPLSLPSPPQRKKQNKSLFLTVCVEKPKVIKCTPKNKNKKQRETVGKQIITKSNFLLQKTKYTTLNNKHMELTDE